MTYNGTASNPSPVNIGGVSFNFFAFNGAGFGPAAAENIDSSGGYAFNSPQVSAKPGQIMVAYGTGLGAISTPDSQAAPGSSPTTPIQVFVGGVAAPVAYSGRAPRCRRRGSNQLHHPRERSAGMLGPALRRCQRDHQ